MKRLLIVFLIGFMVFKALGQPSVDIGIFGGTGTYLGDMTKVEFSKSVNPAYGAFVRYNFNPRYGVRFNVVNGTIGAQGEYDAKYWDFDKNVLDISLQFEFNFFKYIVGEKTTPYSTYLFAGVGVQSYDYEIDIDKLTPLVDPSYIAMADVSGPVMSPTLPFGVGFKVNLSKRIGLGFEGGMRKTFSDKLDDLDDPKMYMKTDGTEVIEIRFADRYHNNDWTAYAGIHLVYKLIYGNKDWTVTTPRSKILDWGIKNNEHNR